MPERTVGIQIKCQSCEERNVYLSPLDSSAPRERNLIYAIHSAAGDGWKFVRRPDTPVCAPPDTKILTPVVFKAYCPECLAKSTAICPSVDEREVQACLAKLFDDPEEVNKGIFVEE